MLEKLNWDTNFFGYKIGKAVADESKFDLHAFFGEAKNYRLTYLFSSIPIQHASLLFVDEKVVFTRSILSDEISTQNDQAIQSFNSQQHSYKQLEALALESGKYSRFKTDPNFQQKEFERLYLKWIAVSEEECLDIPVYVISDELKGFTTLQKKSDELVDIGLVAVHPSAQGKGIGHQLIRHTIQKALSLGFAKIQVVTQANNEAACHLYKKNNFLLTERTYIYHYWNHDTI